MLLIAFSLMSIGHLEALNPRQTSYNRRLFKTQVLVLVNGRLRDATRALEDKTLGALACLTSYEASEVLSCQHTANDRFSELTLLTDLARFDRSEAAFDRHIANHCITRRYGEHWTKRRCNVTGDVSSLGRYLGNMHSER